MADKNALNPPRKRQSSGVTFKLGPRDAQRFRHKTSTREALIEKSRAAESDPANAAGVPTPGEPRIEVTRRAREPESVARIREEPGRGEPVLEGPVGEESVLEEPGDLPILAGIAAPSPIPSSGGPIDVAPSDEPRMHGNSEEDRAGYELLVPRKRAVREVEAPAAELPSDSSYNETVRIHRAAVTEQFASEDLVHEDSFEETSFPIPSDLPNTTSDVLHRGLESRKENHQTHRSKGGRKRGTIPGTDYTRAPDTHASHKDFVDYLEPGTALHQYTQVLIWCLNRRVTRFSRDLDASTVRTTAQECARMALAELVNSLARGTPSLAWTHRKALSPGPCAPNPQNESNERNLTRFKEHLTKLMNETREWLKLSSEWERYKQSVFSGEYEHDIETAVEEHSLEELLAVHSAVLGAPADHTQPRLAALTSAIQTAGATQTKARACLDKLPGNIYRVNRLFGQLNLVEAAGEDAVASQSVRVAPQLNTFTLLGALASSQKL